MNTIPTVTKNLLIINVLMFLGTIVAQSYGIDLNIQPSVWAEVLFILFK